MTTHASPTLGPTTGLSVWQVEMSDGSDGPVHVFDTEQVWTVLEGAISVVIAGETESLGPGDTVVMPPGLERQVSATSDARLLVCGHGNAIARVPGEPAPRGTPEWIA